MKLRLGLAVSLVLAVSFPRPLCLGESPRPRDLPVSRHLGTPRRLDVVATAYTAFDDEGMDGKGITYTGTVAAEHRTVAVDPTVIPLGSTVFIPALADSPNGGWFVAEDTGSAIKGLRIDVFIPEKTEALAFGVRRLEVYVVPQ